MLLIGTRGTPNRGSQAARPRVQTSAPREGRATVFTAGLLVGLAIGAGIALLVAPQSGAEARQALIRRGRRLRRRGANAWDDLRDEFRRVARSRRRNDERDEDEDEEL
jgi:hypothetical protein